MQNGAIFYYILQLEFRLEYYFDVIVKLKWLNDLFNFWIEIKDAIMHQFILIDRRQKQKNHPFPMQNAGTFFF